MEMAQAVKAAITDAYVRRGGVGRLLKFMKSATLSPAQIHILEDAFVGAACRAQTHLSVAERVARKRVALQPDRYHLLHLSNVLKLRGLNDESKEWIKK